MTTPISHVMPTYGRMDVTFKRGEGSWLFDDNGDKYLDALSGIAVCGLGHAHPEVTKAITAQAGELIHTSNLYQIKRQTELADRLTELSQMESIFFCNSGAESNEAAIKLARKYGHNKGILDPMIVVMSGAFHGRTLATLTATANQAIKEGFGPLPAGFIRVPYLDEHALESALKANPNIVAVLLEPIQGEGGLSTAKAHYLETVRALCDQFDALMMLDEVQTGNGRTGQYFCYQHTSALPDVVTTAKGLGNGVPIGACLSRGKAAHVLQPGSHGSTYGGNPLACAAALAVINTLENERLIEHAQQLGDWFAKTFKQRLLDTGKITEIRGKGLMIGLVLEKPCTELAAKALEHKLLINVTSNHVVRLLPPLNMSQTEAQQVADLVCLLIEEHLSAA